MLQEQIEKLRAHVHEVAAREQGLLRSLRETMSLAEDELLQHVREIAVQHSERRALVLSELQGLATRIGKFSRPLNVDAEQQYPHMDSLFQSEPATPTAITTGDWRRAASIIEEDETMVELLHANAR